VTFTYTPSTPTDATRVRFHIGDTVEAAAMFTDEEIAFVISEESTWQAAVIACLLGQIAKLSAQPDLKADWLTVSLGRSVEGFKTLLAEKRAKFGIAARTGSTVATYRSDSLQTEAPEW
jgi:hypothetical protein